MRAIRGTDGLMSQTASPHHIEIVETPESVIVEIGWVRVAESRAAKILYEGSLPPRYYLPKEDVKMELFRPTETSTTCPFKGRASYWSAEIDGVEHPDVMWAYEDPIPEAADIAGLVCFYNDKVDLRIG